jgi:hypothetical protein
MADGSDSGTLCFVIFHLLVEGKHSQYQSGGRDPGNFPGKCGNGITESSGRATSGGGEAQQEYRYQESQM